MHFQSIYQTINLITIRKKLICGFFEEEKNHIPLNNVVFVIVLLFRVLFFPESTLPKKKKRIP